MIPVTFLDTFSGLGGHLAPKRGCRAFGSNFWSIFDDFGLLFNENVEFLLENACVLRCVSVGSGHFYCSLACLFSVCNLSNRFLKLWLCRHFDQNHVVHMRSHCRFDVFQQGLVIFSSVSHVCFPRATVPMIF